MQAKTNLLRTLLVLPVVLLVAGAVALFGLGLRTAETQTTTASTTTYYEVQDLGTLGDNGRYSSAKGINDSGQVVGYSRLNDGYDHAFLYDGTMHDLGTLWSGGSSYAYDINNSGQVVGSSGHAFIYDSANGMKDLNDVVPAWDYPDLPIEGAWAINSDGKIAAGAGYGGSFLLTPATTATPATYEVQYLGTLENEYGYEYGYVSPTDINDSGQAVGTEVWNWNEGGSATDWNGFLYDESATPKMHDLGRGLSPTDINNSGKVLVGSSLYDSATQQSQDLGTVGGYYSSRPSGLNDKDQVVGSVCNEKQHSGTDGSWYYDSCHASLKESGKPMIDLSTLIPPNSGWTIEGATAINIDGKIAANGSKAGVGTHALVLTPTSDIPAPNITSSPNIYDSDGSFSVSGTAIAASTVELFEGTTSTGKTTKADSSSGAWSIDLSGVSEGAHTYSAKAKDAAGNTSSASNTVTVTVDKTAPMVKSVTPSDRATGVSPSTTATASFSEDMDPATLTTSTFTLTKQGSATPITATVSYDTTTKTATLKPSSTLAANTKYTATVKGGASGTKDKAGNALASNKVWSFTTKK